MDAYIDAHYQKAGVGVVFVQGNIFMLTIESHQFQPKNYWCVCFRALLLIIGDVSL